MDAEKFIKEKVRMCYHLAGGYCSRYCPLRMKFGTCSSEDLIAENNIKEAISIVEEWATSHPRKTRQSVFLEQWPNAEFDCKGVIAIDPCDVDKTMRGKDGDCYRGKCDNCRREFWRQEVE